MSEDSQTSSALNFCIPGRISGSKPQEPIKRTYDPEDLLSFDRAGK
jgi:hypothetical protein